MNENTPQFAFFGGEPLGVPVLEELEAADLLPQCVVASPDRPAGRKQVMTPPPVKAWAEERDIPVFQPKTLKDKDALLSTLCTGANKSSPPDCFWDLFVVVAYNHLLPGWLIEYPKHGSINLHPSLLPKLRGPSPIRSAILRDEPEAVGVTIIRLDAEMDHGPIIAREALQMSDRAWPPDGRELDRELAARGGKLLADTIPKWVAGKLPTIEQNHEAATYTKRLDRSDGELTLDPTDLPRGYAAREALLKIRAFAGYPETFFLHEGKRVKIKEATIGPDGRLKLLRVVPESKAETDFSAYLSSLGT